MIQAMQDWTPPQEFPTFRSFDVRRLSGACGGEVSGLDLSADLTDETIEELKTALDLHHVLFFRDQALAPVAQAAFAARFGPLVRYPLVTGLAEAPEVIPVVKRAGERHNFGGLWHADTTYLAEPPLGAMLYAVTLPPFGGDTLFANAQLAFETLSPALQAFLQGLTVVQTSGKAETTRTREDRVKDQGGPPAPPLVAEHPAVIRHPRNGRNTLYVNFGHTERFKELSAEESAPLLDYLYAHLARPEFTCRFRWTEGAMAFWDNAAVQHNPVNDYHGFERVMHRVIIGGGRPERA
jgi:taurine dioxygenase